MPSLVLQVIRPIRPVVVDAERQMRQAEAVLGQVGFAGELIRRMAKYPPQQPAFGARQSLGRAMGAMGALKRARVRVGPKEYVRTGTLGRGWQMSRFGRVGNDIVVDVTNLVPYAVHVQGDPNGPPGERQTDVMESKGWQNIVEEGNAVFQMYRPRLVRVFYQR